jgi:hypothetical protein
MHAMDIVNIIDQFDNMATACSNWQMYIYNSSGSYFCKSIPTVSNPYYMAYDSKSRKVVVT